MPLHPHTPFDDLEPAAVLTAVEVAERIRVGARSVRRAVARRGGCRRVSASFATPSSTATSLAHPSAPVRTSRCPTLGYADAEDHVIGGSLLDTGCPQRGGTTGDAAQHRLGALAAIRLRRCGAERVSDDLLDVAAFAFRAFGQAVERPAIDGNRDGHRDVRVAGRDVDISSCERVVERVGSVVVNVGHVFHP
jgi:hypothetical protein